jgi:NDP-sugar pyrophosphorylase family protein
MLLAAGLGTRLHPLTADRAKPAVPFLGKPLILGLVELLHQHGITKIAVNTHHLPESIHRALAGVAGIGYSHEDLILGTGGALAAARDLGLLDRNDDTLIVNAKLYTDLDLSAAIAAHGTFGAAVTLVLRPNLDKEAFREVLVKDDRVIGFGKGRQPEGDAPLLFTGIHVIASQVLASIPNKNCDTIADIYPPLIAQRRVYAHVDPRGRWWEFSTLERYLELHARVQSVTLSEGAAIDPSAEVEYAVLFENARVEAGAFVKNAILGPGVVVPAKTRVENEAIVGEHRIKVSDLTLRPGPETMSPRR